MESQFPDQAVWLGDHETLATATGGVGRPMVLIHALGLDRRMWRDVMPVLAPRRRVLAYDLRGHGHAAGAPKPFTLNGFAADLGSLIDVLGFERVALVGLSLGGAVAQYFTLANPERVSALSLVCTMARPQSAYLERAVAAEREGMAAQLEPTLRRWFTPRTLAENDWAVAYARDRILSAEVADWAASWRALAEIDTEHRLSEIAVPTQVIAAELDPATPPELMRRLAAHIPKADFHVVPGGGHMLSLEKPAELAALLLDLHDA
jgi:3-oxoadipate enol-lactonase